MTILVTGSTGTIGAQVLAQLHSRHADVRALTRSPETAQLPAGVTAVRGDIADPDSLRAALQGVSTLFLLAHGACLPVLPRSVCGGRAVRKRHRRIPALAA